MDQELKFSKQAAAPIARASKIMGDIRDLFRNWIMKLYQSSSKPWCDQILSMAMQCGDLLIVRIKSSESVYRGAL